MPPPSKVFLLAFFCFAPAGLLRSHETDPYFSGGRIVIESKINGHSVSFIFDTGSDFSAIFQPVAEKLQIGTTASREISIGGHRVNLKKSEPLDLEVFGGKRKEEITILPLPNPPGVGGLFCWRDLPASIYLIDGFDRTLRVLKKAPATGWQRWPLEKETRQLFFEVTRQGESFGRVFVDTGSHGGLRLAPRLWKEWRQNHPDVPVSLEAFQYVVGDVLVSEIAWAEEYRLGDLVFRNIDIGSLPGESEDLAIDAKGKPFLATIGSRALRQLRMIVDHPAGEILTQTVSLIPNHNRLGAVFLPSEGAGSELVARVLKDSPADKAGIRNGDILITINGTDVDGSNAKLPDALFSKPPGTVLKMKIDRSGEVKEFSVTLENVLDSHSAGRSGESGR